MLIFICFLLSLLHILAIFKYSSTITKIKNYKLYYGVQFINIIIIFILIFYNIKIKESIFMLLYFLIFLIEFNIIFKNNYLKNLFRVSSFSVNFFSLKLIVISLISIIYKKPLYIILENEKIYFITLILTIFLANLYFLILLAFLPIKNLTAIMISKDNLKLGIFVLMSLFIFLFLNSYLFYIKKDFNLISILTLKSGVCSIIIFLATLQFSYIFSKLQLYAIKTKYMEKEIKQDEILLNKLKHQILYDDFTSCFKREFIYEKIDELLKENPFFCLVFIDIDGLKITNDKFGHDEGDFYIKAVADILNKEFIGKIVARIGGDEFLVLLNLTDIYATTKCLIRCSETISNISKEYSKPYQTSISYGIVQVTPNNILSRDDIIKIADERMYDYKKNRKKNRK